MMDSRFISKDYYFYSWPSMFSVLILGLNDHLFKAAFAGTSLTWVTGKISDFAAAFFLPLFLEVILGRMLPKQIVKFSLEISCFMVFCILILLECSNTFIVIYQNIHQTLFAYLPWGWSSKLVMDLTDLFALPMIGFSYALAQKKYSIITYE